LAHPPEIQPDWALFLDLDGTLLDLAAKPDLVSVPAGLPGALDALSRRLGGAVAVVSGRALGVIDHLLTPYCAPAGAEHGTVVRLPDGTLDETRTPMVPRLWLHQLEVAAERTPGFVIERKPHSVVVHYRLAPERGDEARALACGLPGLEQEGFVVLCAHMAYEVMPSAASKRRPVALLMETPPFAGRVPVFVGDDVTDEDGIAMARGLGGFGLRVRDDFGGSPAEVRAWVTRGAA